MIGCMRRRYYSVREARKVVKALRALDFKVTISGNGFWVIQGTDEDLHLYGTNSRIDLGTRGDFVTVHLGRDGEYEEFRARPSTRDGAYIDIHIMSDKWLPA